METQTTTTETIEEVKEAIAELLTMTDIEFDANAVEEEE
jgi:hypothetical protein